MPLIPLLLLAGGVGAVGGFTLSKGISRSAWLILILGALFLFYSKKVK
ncbi:hypothetical protein ACPV5O_26320 [Vibrio maritimus]